MSLATAPPRLLVALRHASAGMSFAAPLRRRRLLHSVASLLCAAWCAAASSGPRQSSPVRNVPSSAPPLRHSLQPYVVVVTTLNGDSYVNGVGAYGYTSRRAALPAKPAD